MILLDTSFLYAYFQREDVHHKEALKLAKQADENQVGMPLEILEELLTVITRKISSEEAIKVGSTLIHSDSPIQVLYPNEEQFKRAWTTFRARSPHRFSFPDCVLLTLANHFAWPVFTFDKILKEQISKNRP